MQVAPPLTVAVLVLAGRGRSLLRRLGSQLMDDALCILGVTAGGIDAVCAVRSRILFDPGLVLLHLIRLIGLIRHLYVLLSVGG
jgi:hypothetical protein